MLRCQSSRVCCPLCVVHWLLFGVCCVLFWCFASCVLFVAFVRCVLFAVCCVLIGSVFVDCCVLRCVLLLLFRWLLYALCVFFLERCVMSVGRCLLIVCGALFVCG